MNLTGLHRRLLADVLAVGGTYPLALTGGYAVQAHGLVDVQATADHWSHVELEELGRRHARDSFDLHELQARLGGAD